MNLKQRLAKLANRSGAQQERVVFLPADPGPKGPSTAVAGAKRIKRDHGEDLGAFLSRGYALVVPKGGELELSDDELLQVVAAGDADVAKAVYLEAEVTEDMLARAGSAKGSRIKSAAQSRPPSS